MNDTNQESLLIDFTKWISEWNNKVYDPERTKTVIKIFLNSKNALSKKPKNDNQTSLLDQEGVLK